MNNKLEYKKGDNILKNKDEIASEDELSFESISSIKNNSISSSVITDIKNQINKSFSNHEKSSSSKKNKIIQENTPIPRLLNIIIENSSVPLLNIKLKNLKNKSLIFLKLRYNFITTYSSKG